jgi:heme exporter protein A
MGAAISARAVTKRFAGAAALSDLDLDLPAGASLAVVGPNGAGKSTLLRLLAGLSRPSSGEIAIDGRAPTHRSARAALGYLGHATLLSPSLTVRENLIFVARLYGVADPRGRADARLASEGIEALADRRAGTLSRGQAQRVAIARALIHAPALVLLDEPFTGLDRGAAQRLAARLAELRAHGHTSVLVTHGLDHVRELADQALVLAAGRAVWRGRVAETGDELERALASALERPGASCAQRAAGEPRPSGRHVNVLLAILWKDLVTEWRSRDRAVAMALFAMLVVAIFEFALPEGASERLARSRPRCSGSPTCSRRCSASGAHSRSSSRTTRCPRSRSRRPTAAGCSWARPPRTC